MMTCVLFDRTVAYERLCVIVCVCVCLEYQCLHETLHDSFYIRCQMSLRCHHAKDLKMKLGDILHVTNSREGENSYLAWKVKHDGTESEKGTIPNKAKYNSVKCMD